MMPHILVIEDEPAIAMVFQEFLCEEGYAVTVALNGIAGLEKLRQGPPPDAVIVDLFMPGMGGREVIQSMRAEPLLAHVPVIVITGAVPDAKDFPPEGSFQALLGKPFELKDVLQRVEQLTAAPHLHEFDRLASFCYNKRIVRKGLRLRTNSYRARPGV